MDERWLSVYLHIGDKVCLSALALVVVPNYLILVAEGEAAAQTNHDVLLVHLIENYQEG